MPGDDPQTVEDAKGRIRFQDLFRVTDLPVVKSEIKNGRNFVETHIYYNSDGLDIFGALYSIPGPSGSPGRDLFEGRI